MKACTVSFVSSCSRMMRPGLFGPAEAAAQNQCMCDGDGAQQSEKAQREDEPPSHNSMLLWILAGVVPPAASVQSSVLQTARVIILHIG